MTKKTMGRSGGDRPTQKTSDNRNPTAIASFVKTVIVWLAVRGLLPLKLAELLIRRLHLEAA
jgi:hypothetical protein